ncbi:MAG: hypothetical protein CL908_23680 [Deltaproteobacteria bacterium]|nr:hypothetical protein [Deltaproteobacteria bacterium]
MSPFVAAMLALVEFLQRWAYRPVHEADILWRSIFGSRFLPGDREVLADLGIEEFSASRAT